MAVKIGIGLGMQIVEARHVYGAVEKHWIPIELLGGTVEDKKRFAGTIASCEKVVLGVFDPEPSLEDKRAELRDALGTFRVRGGLIANGMDGRNTAVERELRLDKPFPLTDTAMRRHVTGLPRVVKKYAPKLAARGFGKDDQARLIALCHDFLAMLKARGKERGEARAARTERDALFETLRHQTSYFRRLGRAALINSAARSDFDRVKRDPKSQRKVAPEQAMPSMTSPIAPIAAGAK